MNPFVYDFGYSWQWNYGHLIAVIGFGWMGQAHARSYARLPMIFDGLEYRAELTVCADTMAQRREMAVRDFGFGEATDDWRAAVVHPDVIFRSDWLATIHFH